MLVSSWRLFSCTLKSTFHVGSSLCNSCVQHCRHRRKGLGMTFVKVGSPREGTHICGIAPLQDTQIFLERLEVSCSLKFVVIKAQRYHSVGTFWFVHVCHFPRGQNTQHPRFNFRNTRSSTRVTGRFVKASSECKSSKMEQMKKRVKFTNDLWINRLMNERMNNRWIDESMNDEWL